MAATEPCVTSTIKLAGQQTTNRIAIEYVLLQSIYKCTEPNPSNRSRAPTPYSKRVFMTNINDDQQRRDHLTPCKGSQCIRGLRQWPQSIIETDGPRKKKRVICDCPPNAELTGSFSLRPIRVFFPPRKGHAHRNPRFNAPPQPRKAAPVAESVCQDNRQERPGTQIHKGSIPAKHGGVGELKYRPEQRRNDRGVRVGHTELIEMMRMGNSEVERRDKDDMAGRDLGEQVQRDNGGPKDDLLGDRALLLSVPGYASSRDTHSYVVPPADPPSNGFGDSASSDPVFPFPFGKSSLEQRPYKQNGRQKQGLGDIREINGPPSHELEGLGERGIAFLDNQPENGKGTNDAGQGYGPDSGADNRGGIAAEGGRRPSGGRDIEGSDIEHDQEDLTD
jgi:hypothetical protein